MDPNSGKVFESFNAAVLAGVKDPVEIVGTPEAVRRISAAVKAKHKAERKAQKKARRNNR